jgi:hypothetical protein
MNRVIDREVRAAAVPPVSPERALYVYGIIRAARPLRFEATAIDERWPVRTLHHRSLAAVVSEVPPAVLEATRANLLAHERVNAAVLRDHTVIPMAFGTVFRSRQDVEELLRSTHDTFVDVLEKLHGKIEFGLKVLWDRDEAIRAIEAQDPDIRELRRELAWPDGASFATRMEYGQRLDAALARRAQAHAADFLQRLRDVCVASRCNANAGDRMIMNAAFLVQRAGEAAFERRVRAIGEEFDGFTFQYSGPWPPYNFVAIRLRREPA